MLAINLVRAINWFSLKLERLFEEGGGKEQLFRVLWAVRHIFGIQAKLVNIMVFLSEKQG